MSGTDPGDRIPSSARQRPRRLSEPPSARFSRRSADPSAPAPGAGLGIPSGVGARSALPGPVARASLVAVLGAAALVGVGGVLASTFGLLFIAGATGAAVGLIVARAAVPLDGAIAAPRRTIVRLALALALAAVALGDLGLWLVARNEGGVLGPFDYLWTTFGPFVPGVALVAGVTAWWGASAGPVQR